MVPEKSLPVDSVDIDSLTGDEPVELIKSVEYSDESVEPVGSVELLE